MGSPGMEYGDKKDSYAVYAFNEHGQVFEYRSYQGNRWYSYRNLEHDALTI